jgi:hypothetical protein
MVRTIFGTFSGALAAGLVLIGCCYGIARIHPLPTSMDFATPDSLSEYAAATPTSAMLCILGAWALASGLGGWTAARISKAHRCGAALTIGILLTATVLVYATLIPNAEWVTVAGVLLPIPFAVVAALMARPRDEI